MYRECRQYIKTSFDYQIFLCEKQNVTLGVKRKNGHLHEHLALKTL